MPTKDPETLGEIRRENRRQYRASHRDLIHAQKRRARARKKALAEPKPPKTHCRNGHPENRNAQGQCRTCRNESKQRRLATLMASKLPKVRALTAVEQRAADPEGYRAKERESESRYLGKPVLTREEYLKIHACTKNPEELRIMAHAANKKSQDKKRGKTPRIPMTKEEAKVKRVERRRHASLSEKGWNQEMYTQTALEQGDRCAICRLPQRDWRYKVLCADHEHCDPPKPRGLLCHHCNFALGLLNDNPETCRAAAEYLEAWS